LYLLNGNQITDCRVTCVSAVVPVEVEVRFQVNLISTAVNMKLVHRLTTQPTN